MVDKTRITRDEALAYHLGAEPGQDRHFRLDADGHAA